MSKRSLCTGQTQLLPRALCKEADRARRQTLLVQVHGMDWFRLTLNTPSTESVHISLQYHSVDNVAAAIDDHVGRACVVGGNTCLHMLHVLNCCLVACTPDVHWGLATLRYVAAPTTVCAPWSKETFSLLHKTRDHRARHKDVHRDCLLLFNPR